MKQVFMFYSADEKKVKDYKVDGYVWRNMGANKPVLLKSYYKVICKDRTVNNEFCKDVFMLIDDVPHGVPVLVHYNCGEKENEDMEMEIENRFAAPSHDNCIKRDGASASFQPTLPSVLSELKEAVYTINPHKVYKNMSKKTNGVRNLKKCQNIRYVSI
jgi:hypothetical protein